MAKLRLHRDPVMGEEMEADVYRFPVEAARQMGSGLLERGSEGDSEVIGDLERALDRVQDRLDELSAELDTLPFPGVRQGGDGPSAA